MVDSIEKELRIHCHALSCCESFEGEQRLEAKIAKIAEQVRVGAKSLSIARFEAMSLPLIGDN